MDNCDEFIEKYYGDEEEYEEELEEIEEALLT